MTYTFPITYPKITRDDVDLGAGSGTIASGFTDTFEVDAVSFMETFVPPNLKKVKSSLQKSKYSEEQISEIIAGLKTLPECKGG